MRGEDGGGQRRKGAKMREEGEGERKKSLCGGKEEKKTKQRRHTSLQHCSRCNYTIYTATPQGRPPQGHFSLTAGLEKRAEMGGRLGWKR